MIELYTGTSIGLGFKVRDVKAPIRCSWLFEDNKKLFQ